MLRMQATGWNKFWRWALWPLLVITAFNIENWAEKAGYGSLLSSEVWRGGMIADLSDLLTSYPAQALMFFVMGATAFAYIEYWIERTMGKGAGAPDWIIRQQAEIVAELIVGNRKHSGTTLEKYLIELNRYLRRKRLPYAPVTTVLEDDVVARNYAGYLFTLSKIKRLSDAVEDPIKYLPSGDWLRQPRADTEQEIQP
jgi:hypothetical protein